MPLRHRHGYAADLHRDLPNRRHQPAHEFPAIRAGARHCPAHIRQIGAGVFVLRGVRSLVPHVHLPVLLAGPAPSGSTGTSRRCRGCFPPSPTSPRIRLPPAPTAPLRWPGDGGLSPPFGRTAPHGASISQLHTWFGSNATSSGFTVAGWVACRRRSRLSPAWRSSR